MDMSKVAMGALGGFAKGALTYDEAVKKDWLEEKREQAIRSREMILAKYNHDLAIEKASYERKYAQQQTGSGWYDEFTEKELTNAQLEARMTEDGGYSKAVPGKRVSEQKAKKTAEAEAAEAAMKHGYDVDLENTKSRNARLLEGTKLGQKEVLGPKEYAALRKQVLETLDPDATPEDIKASTLALAEESGYDISKYRKAPEPESPKDPAAGKPDGKPGDVAKKDPRAAVDALIAKRKGGGGGDGGRIEQAQAQMTPEERADMDALGVGIPEVPQDTNRPPMTPPPRQDGVTVLGNLGDLVIGRSGNAGYIVFDGSTWRRPNINEIGMINKAMRKK
jgi:hypothetical protein